MTHGLSLRATPLRLANDDTIAALRILTPAHLAEEGDLVGLSRDFRLDGPTDLPREGETKLWSLCSGRFMPRRVALVPEPQRAAAGLAHALLSEDQTVDRLVLTAVRNWRQVGENTSLTILYVPGGAVVYRNILDLRGGDRTPTEAQDHLTQSMVVFIPEASSNHSRLEFIPGLSACVSDLATWGTAGRHFPDVSNTTVHKVDILI